MHILCSHIFSVIIFFIHVLANKDSPNLGITRDNPDGSPDKKTGGPPTIFSSKLTFHKHQDVWKDFLQEDEKKFAQIAKDAWWQMNKLWIEEDTHTRLRPLVMTALAVGNEIYLSSSMKGGAFIYTTTNDDNPVRIALHKCQIAMREFWPDLKDNEVPKGYGINVSPLVHRMHASCGEVMVLYMYFQDHPEEAQRYQATQTSALQGSHIVTARNTLYFSQMNSRGNPKNEARTVLDYNEIVRMSPCATVRQVDPKPVEQGCAQLTQQFGLVAILQLGEGIKPSTGFTDIDLPQGKEDMSTAHVPFRCERQPGLR